MAIGRALAGILLASAMAAPAMAFPALSLPGKTGSLKAEIVRTAYGIPHVTAKDYAGIGYGQAYAYAQDNLCMIADKIVSVNGERSKYFGPEGTTTVAFQDIPNRDADFFFRSYLQSDALAKQAKGFSRDYAELLRGYAAGYNRYLADTPVAKRPAACRDAAWVRPITVVDLLRLNEERMVQASGGAWLRQIVSAAPPVSVSKPQAFNLRGAPLPGDVEPFGLGSNGWAFGREVTENKSGMLLGNPHFPWETTNRFYEMHLTIPGKLDVMGSTIGGSPGMSIGFNKDVAWTHTVSTDRHFTFFELALDAKDPTAYLVDGKTVPMTRREVTIEVKGSAPETRTLYSTVYGPVVVMPQAGITWNSKTAYAMRDANLGNSRSGDTWMAIAKARNVGEIRNAIQKTLGIPWVNTIAADRAGDALYADVTATPNVSAEKLKSCAPASGMGPLAAANRLYLLDGSRSACNWDIDRSAAAPGLMPGKSMPAVIRQDYVANSNDSYWLVNAKVQAPVLSPLVGPGAQAQNLRTRSGLIEIENRIAGRDDLGGQTLTLDRIKAMLFANKNLGADLIMADLQALCTASPVGKLADGREVKLAEACRVLAGWSRRMDADAQGALLFIEFYKLFDRIPGVYAVAFDPSEPVNTPRGISASAETQTKVRNALATVVAQMADRKIPLDAPYGAFHFAVRGNQRIPVHGGEGGTGVLNAQQARYVPAVGGYVPYHGSSYIQAVTFDDKGPVADAVLSYSQSTDPDSAHFADQTWLYARKGWVRLPFHRADIEADPAFSRMEISE
jgi:acyl-homoserine-lactone acylase